MLDHIATKQQINVMVREQKSIQQAHTGRLERALREARRWTVDWQFLADKVSRSKTSWLVADILEPISLRRSKPERPKELTVLATDGSQIFPDRHEVSSCYLINVGTIAIHYGTGERPLLTSRPTLFYKDDDLYYAWGGQRTPVNAEIVSIRRGAMELTELANLAAVIPERNRKAVALSDGTLIFWTLEGKPEDFKRMMLTEALAAFDRLADARAAVAGYISYSNSTDVVNALRVGLCPEETVPACETCPQRTYHPSLPPCTVIEGLMDRMLFSRLLRDPGDRSVLFRSTSEILNEYGRHRIYFFYINVGYEIARVEIPEWVALDPELLDRVHAAVYDQVEKGKGYPIILAEAHEKAIIRGADRDLFYRLLSDSYVIGGVRSELSRKNIAKRRLMI
ncbi:MAG: DNA double-strand break repair nuclease NurA [Candidatus Latescibacteria bacterium]|nr:DNA double-strand break repair nuclease NurA [Candidatus Latescibacterota bacterium]